MEIVKIIVKVLVTSFLTENFIKEMIIFLVEKIAKKTDNTIDDELVEKIKNALIKKD